MTKLIKRYVVIDTQDIPVSDAGMSIGQCVDFEISNMVRDWCETMRGSPELYLMRKLQSVTVELDEDDWGNLIIMSSQTTKKAR